MLSAGGGWRWCWRGAAGEGGWCGSSAPSVAAMIHYTLEPQFNALIFSVSARHERFTLLPDPFVCCTHGPPAAATDLLAYLHAVGVQLATLGDHYACLLTQGKRALPPRTCCTSHPQTHVPHILIFQCSNFLHSLY